MIVLLVVLVINGLYISMLSTITNLCLALQLNWLSPASDTDLEDRELMSAFYNYSEPFSCECRAFGRL